MVVDAVINYCESMFKVKNPNREIPKVLFYADDGVITGTEATLVHDMLDITPMLFCK